MCYGKSHSIGNGMKTTNASCHHRAYSICASLIPVLDRRRDLARRGPSNSGFVQRISAEQAQIESRLVDLVGVEALRSTLQGTSINSDGVEDMIVDGPRPISAKQRVLDQFVCAFSHPRIILMLRLLGFNRLHEHPIRLLAFLHMKRQGLSKRP
jgi:hypothetical protein